jgi:predicted phage-related endonuclease
VGIDQEPFARAALELRQGYFVQETGFVPHPTIEMAGASPDGLINEDGICEIKCPESQGMVETLLSKKVPQKYYAQMQFQLACTGRKWCDFVSFDPRMDEGLQLFIKRVEFDPVYVAKLEKEVLNFLFDVEYKITQLNKLKD